MNTNDESGAETNPPVRKERFCSDGSEFVILEGEDKGTRLGRPDLPLSEGQKLLLAEYEKKKAARVQATKAPDE